MGFAVSGVRLSCSVLLCTQGLQRSQGLSHVSTVCCSSTSPLHPTGGMGTGDWEGKASEHVRSVFKLKTTLFPLNCSYKEQ